MAARINVTKIKKKGTSNKREISRVSRLLTIYVKYATSRLDFSGRSLAEVEKQKCKQEVSLLQSCNFTHTFNSPSLVLILTDPCA